MKAAEIIGQRQVVMTDRETPRARGDIVLIETEVIPMCTEWRDWRDGNHKSEIGHEAIGRVVDSADSSLLEVGERVVVMPHAGCGRCAECVSGEHIHCRQGRDLLRETDSRTGIGTYAELLLKPDYLVAPVPPDLSLQHAAMAVCALGPTFTATQRMKVEPGETLLVSGCGAVGLGAVVNAVACGARVIALELHPYRSDLARRLGAEAVLDPLDPGLADAVAELTGGIGVDAAIETSNTAAGAKNVQALTRSRGRISFVSWTGTVDVPAIVAAGQTIYGCWHWNHDLYAEEMFERIRAVGSALDLLATHSFPLSEVDAAFALQETGECGKVLLYPDAEAKASKR